MEELSLAELRARDDVQAHLKEAADEIPDYYDSGTAGVFLLVVRLLATPKTFAAIRKTFADWPAADTGQTKLKQSCLNVLDGVGSEEDIKAVNAVEHPDDGESDDEDESDDDVDSDDENEPDDDEDESDEDSDEDSDDEDEPDDSDTGTANSGLDAMTRSQLKTRKDALTGKGNMSSSERKEYLAIVQRLESNT